MELQLPLLLALMQGLKLVPRSSLASFVGGNWIHNSLIFAQGCLQLILRN
nr:hypothetical protein Q903MT_gene1973 [Picea sitchensis]